MSVYNSFFFGALRLILFCCVGYLTIIYAREVYACSNDGKFTWYAGYMGIDLFIGIVGLLGLFYKNWALLSGFSTCLIFIGVVEIIEYFFNSGSYKSIYDPLLGALVLFSLSYTTNMLSVHYFIERSIRYESELFRIFLKHPLVPNDTIPLYRTELDPPPNYHMINRLMPSFTTNVLGAIRKVNESVGSNLNVILSLGILGFIALTISSISYLNGSTFYAAATGSDEVASTTLIIPVIISGVGLYGSFFNQHTCLKLFALLAAINGVVTLFGMFFMSSSNSLSLSNKQLLDQVLNAQKNYQWVREMAMDDATDDDRLGTIMWNQLQEQGCCGLDSPAEWENLRPVDFPPTIYPGSCCDKPTCTILMFPTTKLCNKTEIFKIGCRRSLEEASSTLISLSFWVAILEVSLALIAYKIFSGGSDGLNLLSDLERDLQSQPILPSSRSGYYRGDRYDDEGRGGRMMDDEKSLPPRYEDIESKERKGSDRYRMQDELDERIDMDKLSKDRSANRSRDYENEKPSFEDSTRMYRGSKDEYGGNGGQMINIYPGYDQMKSRNDKLDNLPSPFYPNRYPEDMMGSKEEQEFGEPEGKRSRRRKAEAIAIPISPIEMGGEMMKEPTRISTKQKSYDKLSTEGANKMAGKGGENMELDRSQKGRETSPSAEVSNKMDEEAPIESRKSGSLESGRRVSESPKSRRRESKSPESSRRSRSRESKRRGSDQREREELGGKDNDNSRARSAESKRDKDRTTNRGRDRSRDNGRARSPESRRRSQSPDSKQRGERERESFPRRRRDSEDRSSENRGCRAGKEGERESERNEVGRGSEKSISDRGRSEERREKCEGPIEKRQNNAIERTARRARSTDRSRSTNPKQQDYCEEKESKSRRRGDSESEGGKSARDRRSRRENDERGPREDCDRRRSSSMVRSESRERRKTEFEREEPHRNRRFEGPGRLRRESSPSARLSRESDYCDRKERNRSNERCSPSRQRPQGEREKLETSRDSRQRGKECPEVSSDRRREARSRSPGVCGEETSSNQGRRKRGSNGSPHRDESRGHMQEPSSDFKKMIPSVMRGNPGEVESIRGGRRSSPNREPNDRRPSERGEMQGEVITSRKLSPNESAMHPTGRREVSPSRHNRLQPNEAGKISGEIESRKFGPSESGMCLSKGEGSICRSGREESPSRHNRSRPSERREGPEESVRSRRLKSDESAMRPNGGDMMSERNSSPNRGGRKSSPNRRSDEKGSDERRNMENEIGSRRSRQSDKEMNPSRDECLIGRSGREESPSRHNRSRPSERREGPEESVRSRRLKSDESAMRPNGGDMMSERNSSPNRGGRKSSPNRRYDEKGFDQRPEKEDEIRSRKLRPSESALGPSRVNSGRELSPSRHNRSGPSEHREGSKESVRSRRLIPNESASGHMIPTRGERDSSVTRKNRLPSPSARHLGEVESKRENRDATERHRRELGESEREGARRREKSEDRKRDRSPSDLSKSRGRFETKIEPSRQKDVKGKAEEEPKRGLMDRIWKRTPKDKNVEKGSDISEVKNGNGSKSSFNQFNDEECVEDIIGEAEIILIPPNGEPVIEATAVILDCDCD